MASYFKIWEDSRAAVEPHVDQYPKWMHLAPSLVMSPERLRGFKLKRKILPL